MAFNYKTLPTGRPDGAPPLERNAGGYYYKYSYSWTSKAASTDVDLSEAIMQFDSSQKNNGYIFLSCIGTTSSPPEFGIFTAPSYNGVWKCYTRIAGSSDIVPRETIISPSSSLGGKYTYSSNAKITMRIRLLNTKIFGEIIHNGTVLSNYEIEGKNAGIGENSSANTFLVGTSFVPDPPTTSPGGRNSYLKHIYLHEGYLYNTTSYTGSRTEWVPDPANSVTYYSLICNTDYVTYNRFGTRDEEISINYI